jgi:hypothetical protein
MSSPPASTQPPGAAAPDGDDVATPLTPDRVGQAIGENADPEQDVAPNLGGEEQMQDA